MTRRVTWTAERIQCLLQLEAGGHTVAEIATIMKLSKSTVHGRLFLLAADYPHLADRVEFCKPGATRRRTPRQWPPGGRWPTYWEDAHAG